jgi:hypothetical protein
LNDTTIFNINILTGSISNVTALVNITLYNLNVSVNDSQGNHNSGLFWINVTAKPTTNVTIKICPYKEKKV